MKTIKDLPEHSRPLDIQREIDAERELVESNRKLVEIFEKKMQAKLAEIWGEEESAKA
jgi:hypothetical protein